MSYEDFYRVIDDGSRDQINDYDGDIIAGCNDDFHEGTRQARTFIHRHQNWGNRLRTPFISMTSNINTVLRFVEDREARGHTGIEVAFIDGDILRNYTDVYHTHTLMTNHGYRIPNYVLNCEYWALHEITSDAITQVMPYWEFLQDYRDDVGYY